MFADQIIQHIRVSSRRAAEAALLKMGSLGRAVVT